MIEPRYKSDKVELYCADCLDVLPQLEPGSVDAVITDPPYGISVEILPNNTERWKSPPKVEKAIMGWDRSRVDSILRRVIERPGYQIIWGGNYYTDILPVSKSWLVWDKMNSGGFAECEMAWTNCNNPTKIFRYLWNGFRKEKPEERFHPTQKPLALMVWCIQHINGSSTILDPFMGSGTTGVACMQTGRRFIGIEISEDYYKIAEKRIRAAESQLLLPFP